MNTKQPTNQDSGPKKQVIYAIMNGYSSQIYLHKHKNSNTNEFDKFITCIHYSLWCVSGTKVAPGNAKAEPNPSKMETPSRTLCDALVLASIGDPFISSNLKSFCFNDLKNATKSFAADGIIGEGGFGCVFKGWINTNTLAPCKPGTGMVVAVKKLKPQSFQGHREWLVSMAALTLDHC